MVRVYLESEKTWTFACAIHLPGFARRGRSPEKALATLDAYRDRYVEPVVGELEVVATLPGTANTAWAPSELGPWDADPLSPVEIALLQRCWQVFDETASRVSAVLQKGPRGGCRDRDEIVEHVREAERSYARKVGVRVPPRTPWPEQRDAIVAGLAAPADGRWPPRYLVRRAAWHVLDHAWEMQDKDLG